jgi:hypothetical protein
MVEPYTLTATPFLLLEVEDKGHLEPVTFIATSEREMQKWWSVKQVADRPRACEAVLRVM